MILKFKRKHTIFVGMNSLALLRELLEKLQQYEDSVVDKEALSMDGFMRSMSGVSDLEGMKNSLIGKTNPDILHSPHHRENNLERVIAQHLLVLYRYLKFYSKTAFANNKIKSLEEFSFLITVMQHREISKAELIRRNIVEKSSGIEIINRLLKSGMFTQIHNPNDQRSHLILLTELGRQELFSMFHKMDMLGTIATGELNAYEKEQLVKMLKKLDHFHYDNYNNKDLKNLEDYLPPSAE